MIDEEKYKMYYRTLEGEKRKLFILYCIGIIPEGTPCAKINMVRYPYMIMDELMDVGF